MQWQAITPGRVQVESNDLKNRIAAVRAYMLSLSEKQLMQNFDFEAGLRTEAYLSDALLGGWESPTCQLRGHFLGHYLSACALAYAHYGDETLLGRGKSLVNALEACQQAHGTGWVFSIPPTYLSWIARKKRVWAPQYTLHKTLMGLLDMARYARCEKALTIAVKAADWFHDWTGQFSREQFDDILDVETGGMLEAWADLYALTGDEKHKALLERYMRPRLFDALLRGEDVLTNMHANTTVPEMLGLARAFEVTGQARYLDVIHAYWQSAVTERGTFATGGQTCDEIWTPPLAMADRLGPDNQEHCVVYNMIRLADFLFRHTGEIAYLDYIERNFVNGILAQQHPNTGMVAYYLPMQGAAKIRWGTETRDFWCCHGTLVQVHACHGAWFHYQTGDTLLVAQYDAATVLHAETGARVSISDNDERMSTYAPNGPRMQAFSAQKHGRHIRVEVWAGSAKLRLLLRIPWWVQGEAALSSLDGAVLATGKAATFLEYTPAGHEVLLLSLPMGLSICPLPDDPETFAFLHGPDVLAGITARNSLAWQGETAEAVKVLRPMIRSPFRERFNCFVAIGQAEAMEFIPLRNLGDEEFTLYFTRQR